MEDNNQQYQPQQQAQQSQAQQQYTAQAQQQNPYYQTQQPYQQPHQQQSPQQPPYQQQPQTRPQAITTGMKVIWILVGFFVPIIGIWILGFGYNSSNFSELHESMKFLGIGCIINIGLSILSVILFGSMIAAVISAASTVYY